MKKVNWTLIVSCCVLFAACGGMSTPIEEEEGGVLDLEQSGFGMWEASWGRGNYIPFSENDYSMAYLFTNFESESHVLFVTLNEYHGEEIVVIYEGGEQIDVCNTAQLNINQETEIGFYEGEVLCFGHLSYNNMDLYNQCEGDLCEARFRLEENIYGLGNQFIIMSRFEEISGVFHLISVELTE